MGTYGTCHSVCIIHVSVLSRLSENTSWAHGLLILGLKQTKMTEEGSKTAE